MIKEETRTPEGFSVSSQEYHDIGGERSEGIIRRAVRTDCATRKRVAHPDPRFRRFVTRTYA